MNQVNNPNANTRPSDKKQQNYPRYVFHCNMAAEAEFEDPDLCGFEGPGWYFWDETWTVLHGPYHSQEKAVLALQRYMQSL